LIVEGNGSADEIGRCAVWDGSIDPCVYQNHLIRVRCFQQDCMAFIKLFLNAPSGADEMKRLAITTSGLYNLSVGKIRNYVVPVAPLALFAQGIEHAHGGGADAQGVHQAADGGLVVAGLAGGGAPALGVQSGVGQGADGGVGAVKARFRAVVAALRVLQAGGG
jgi:hypothetical protein